MSMPYCCLPLPSDVDLASYRVRKADATRAKDVLLLFLFEQLVRLGIFSADKDIDEQIFYCLGLVSDKVLIEAQMLAGKLPVENGAHHIVDHGKYTHLLQLVLIGIGRELQVEYLQDLHLSTPEIVKVFLDPKHNIKTSDGASINGWDFCLDSANGEYLYGPQALNSYLLSPHAAKRCATFHRYWSLTYVRMLFQQFEADTLLSRANKSKHLLADSLTIIIGRLRSSSLCPEEFVEAHKVKHQTMELCRGQPMFHKGPQRTAEFKRIAVTIRAKQNPQPAGAVLPHSTKA
jgi:hypothetical protein